MSDIAPLSPGDARRFDLVVLGGGPGGYAAALAAAGAGLDVALVEADRVGGTCLHRGCIPAKALLESATVLRTVERAAGFGVHTSTPRLDLAAVQARKAGVVARLAGGLEGLLAHRHVTVVSGTGHLAPSRNLDGVPQHVVALDDGSELAAPHLILATGSTPRHLDALPVDGHTVMDSDGVLALDTLPARVAIVGGGAIGCEFASLLADWGAAVTLLELAPRLLAGADASLGNELTKAFRARGITVHAGISDLTRAEPGTGRATPAALAWTRADGQPRAESFDLVIVAVGRTPRAPLGLEHVGLSLDERGSLPVDAFMATATPGIYAIGDLVVTPQLAHVAFGEALVAVDAILGRIPTPIAYDRVPWGIYSHPEVAFCGLSEDAARAAGHDVVVHTQRFAANGRALVLGEPDGFIKLVADQDGTLLGVHAIGPWATELLAEGYLAVNWEATAGDVAGLLHAHPTLSEVFGEAALALTGRALHG